MPPKRKTVVVSDSEEDEDKNNKKNKSSQYYKFLNRSGPSNPGSKEIPQGQENCLQGLTLVFTGELESLSREEGVELAKKYGAKVTAAPSGRTSYVILGRDAGPKKLETIKAKKIKTLNEDEFLEMVRSREYEMDDKAQEKLKKEQEKIKEDAKELERIEDLQKKDLDEAKSKGNPKSPLKGAPSSSQLWTVKYAPVQLKDICGNKGQVEKITNWLKSWQQNFNDNIKNGASDNSIENKRALLIHGPPGIGKTTAAHLCAKVAGFSPLELNASDVRSKKLIETTTNIDNTSIDTYFGKKSDLFNTVKNDVTHRTCLIFDECDGMSSGDRGGIGAMNTLIKKTRIPIICICNDRYNPKMKPFQSTTGDILFKRPDVPHIRSRIMSILHKEKMKMDPNIVDQLIKGSQSDIRQVINMISTWKLLSSTMNYDEGKALVKDNEKYVIQTPWTIINQLFGPYSFSQTNKQPLSAKIDYYFQDHSLIPLFVQENYLKCNPARTRDLNKEEKESEHLKYLSKAADAISDGDIVDSMIHGSQQQWSLMPLHGVNSSVRPAYFMYGGFKMGYGRDTISFPQWLGQFSKTGKYQRALTDIQAKMRTKVSGERDEIRQYYYPTLWPRLYEPLTKNESAIEEVIDLMDDYMLSKDDWDIMSELGIGNLAHDKTVKNIPTKSKSALTRKYNSTDHPVAFSKAQDIKPATQIKSEKPDHEDVIDDDEGDVVDVKSDEDENMSEDDLSKDKLIKQPKSKATRGGKGTSTRGRGKGRGSKS